MLARLEAGSRRLLAVLQTGPIAPVRNVKP
jgi:hypothetical protein